MKVKTGDLVMCVKVNATYLTLGKQYDVVGSWSDGRDAFYIINDEGEEIPCIYPECEFGKWELVNNDK